MKQPIIEIEYGDWLKEWEASPIKPKTSEDIISTMLETQMSPTQMARLAIVGREQGHADENIVRSNKLSLILGVAQDISQTISSRMVDVEINGKVFRAREFVGTVQTEDSEEGEADGGQTLVDMHDPIAVERATRYLFNLVTGHAWKRLVILAANGEDVESIAETLKSRIDEMVERLS